MRVAVYLRVSTDKQKNENQEQKLIEYCKRKEYTIVAEYRDVISGRSTSRDSRDQLLEAATLGHFDTVLVWKLDRWSRSIRDLYATVDHLTAHNVKFVSATEEIDTNTTAGELLFNILGAVATFERAMLRERIKSGLDRVRSEGKKLGPPVKTTPAQQARIIQMRKDGRSIREVAKTMQLTRSRVEEAIKRNAKQMATPASA